MGPSDSNKGSNAWQAYTQSALPAESMVQVIDDAMATVLKSGLRYLWVDRYCIDQTNPEEKHDQILNMDKIYERASFTIVAAAGDGSHYGLPGVSGRPRTIQALLDVGQVSIFAAMNPLAGACKDSAWTTRGWTYQEAVLSRRCLFFTDEQVHFTCRAMSCREALGHISEATAYTSGRGLLNASLFDPKSHTVSTEPMLRPITDLYSHLSNFKSRHLTFESDILNAFQGILSKFGYKYHWGMPIVQFVLADQADHLLNDHYETSYALCFINELWWETSESQFQILGFPAANTRPPTKCSLLRRCASYPNWSWAGWIGPIRASYGGPSYWAPPADPYEFTFLSKISIVRPTRIEFEMRNGSCLKISEFCRLELTSDLQNQLTHVLQIEAPVVKLRFDPLKDDETSNFKAVHQFIIEGSLREIIFVRFYATNWFDGRLFDESWDCLVLGGRDQDSCRCLLIDWGKDDKGDDIAHVIGKLELPKWRMWKIWTECVIRKIRLR